MRGRRCIMKRSTGSRGRYKNRVLSLIRRSARKRVKHKQLLTNKQLPSKIFERRRKSWSQTLPKQNRLGLRPNKNAWLRNKLDKKLRPIVSRQKRIEKDLKSKGYRPRK